MNTEDIVIVGGGPVGLFLGICLLRHNIPCTILEQRTGLVKDSRSLGIHPVSMELFEKTGLIAEFLQSGIKVFQGIAHNGNSEIGSISFEDCPPPYNYILLNPQYETERILRDHFLKQAPDGLIQGAEVTEVVNGDMEASITFKKGGDEYRISAAYVVGCDGKNSLVRRSAGIHFSGKRYPDTYIMGDFEDTTDYKEQAVIYLPKEGLIECFPFPGDKRRWVIKTDDYISDPSPEHIAEIVKNRIHHTLPANTNSMTSSFGVQHFLAETFDKKRVLLAGDAAHVVSPIGGQGMNLGWLDAWHLANIISFCGRITIDSPLSDFFAYTSRQKPIAKKVARRAEINMSLGRKSSMPFIKNGIVNLMLSPLLSKKTAQLFTMRGLESWWV